MLKLDSAVKKYNVDDPHVSHESITSETDFSRRKTSHTLAEKIHVCEKQFVRAYGTTRWIS